MTLAFHPTLRRSDRLLIVWFKLDESRLIKAGRKTMDRRPATSKPPREGACVGIKIKREWPINTHITILNVRTEPLGALDLRDARREGFRTTLEAREYWRSEHKRYDPSELVHVISFTLGDQTDSDRLPAARPGLPAGDYVSSAARALSGVGAEVSEHLQTKYADEASRGLSVARTARYEESRRSLLSVIAEIRSYTQDNVRAHDKLRGIERQLKALDKAV